MKDYPFALELDKIVKIYGDKNKKNYKLALNDFTLKVPRGKIFGLLGPNGAGKSTMINILAGMVIKTSGVARVLGIDIDKKPKTARTLIGIVPQEILMDTFFPVRDTLELSAGYFGVRPENRKSDEIIDALGLRDKKNNTPKELSGGMRRRLLVAKAMVHFPEILILDEPTAGVDIHLRSQLWQYIRMLSKEHGKTIIITTHYLQEAQELCEEVAFIDAGRIIQQNSTKKMLQDLGSRYIVLSFQDKIEDKTIYALNKKCKVEESGFNKIKIIIEDSKQNFNELIREIAQIDQKITNLNIIEPDLEEVFHKLIK